MRQRHSVTRRLALGLILSLVGLSSQNTTSAQTLAETQQRANQGDALAQTALGFIYQSGDGVPEDLMQAVVWYRIAADQGYAPAQFNLGLRYATGRGVLKDFVLAHMWFNIAEAHGHERARESRYMTVGELTRAEAARAMELARACIASGYQSCEPQ